MAKGDRTDRELRELKSALSKAKEEHEALRHRIREDRAAWQDERKRLMATTPSEIDYRLDECRTVMREAMAEMELLASMLKQWKQD